MNWREYFMQIAHTVALKSKDPSSKVGAVIVDTNGRIVSVGFNGFPRGVPDETVDRDIKLLRTIHAEQNAILFAQRDIAGHHIYSTHMPCARCTAVIVQSGINTVVCPKPDPAFAERWATEITEARYMMECADVQLFLM